MSKRQFYLLSLVLIMTAIGYLFYKERVVLVFHNNTNQNLVVRSFCVSSSIRADVVMNVAAKAVGRKTQYSLCSGSLSVTTTGNGINLNETIIPKMPLGKPVLVDFTVNELDQKLNFTKSDL